MTPWTIVHGIVQARILEWVAINTAVGSLSLLQWIFLTQESNQGLLHYRQILYQLSYQESPTWVSDNSGFTRGSDGKESAHNARGLGSIPRLGRSPGEGHDNSLQYLCWRIPMERAAWQATVHGVTKSWTWLSN